MMVEQLEPMLLANPTNGGSDRMIRDRKMWPVFARVLLFAVLIQAIVILYLREYLTS